MTKLNKFFSPAQHFAACEHMATVRDAVDVEARAQWRRIVGILSTIQPSHSVALAAVEMVID